MSHFGKEHDWTIQGTSLDLFQGLEPGDDIILFVPTNFILISKILFER
jgi:hypothetical protein